MTGKINGKTHEEFIAEKLAADGIAIGDTVVDSGGMVLKVTSAEVKVQTHFYDTVYGKNQPDQRVAILLTLVNSQGEVKHRYLPELKKKEAS